MISEIARRPLGMLALLAGAAGGPYVLYETEAGKQTRQAASHWFEGSASSPNHSNWEDSASTIATMGESMFSQPTPETGQNSWLGKLITTRHAGPASPTPGGTIELWNYTVGVPKLNEMQQPHVDASLVGGPFHDLREVIRFDITPAWVPQRFARVSTVLADVHLDGLRVAIVTGNQSFDLAGTLSYFFDKQQTLRRINFQAVTGDPSGIAVLMQQYYGLKAEASLGGHLYTARWNSQVTSMLHVAPAPIMYAHAQHSRYIVFLELNQPSLPYGLSYEAAQVIQTGHQTERW